MRTIFILLIIAIALAACISTGDPAPPPIRTEPPVTVSPDHEERVEELVESASDTKEVSAVHDDNVLERMSEFLENGKDKVQYGAVTEGIKQLVAVLAEYEKLKSPSEMAEELANEAHIELGRIKSSLILEADPEWYNSTSQMISGSAISIEPQPSVILTIDMGIGRALVGNAPVVFQFVKGGGALTSFVNTNEFGQATCKILNFDSDMDENVIRASLIFREKGYTYEFDGLDLDFVYIPPSKRATIFVMEKSSLGVADDPVIFQPVYDNLKDVAFDFAMYNGILNPDAFQQVYSGDRQAIKSLGLEENVPYLVVVLSDCFSVRELKFGNVSGGFISEGRATLRIIRVADGKILYQYKTSREKSKNTHGQGGSEGVAVKHVLDLLAEDMRKELADQVEEINEALSGKL